MIELNNEDIFDKISEADAICIPTNCSIIEEIDGDIFNPMGALAGAAASRWVDIPYLYAELLQSIPNVPCVLIYFSKSDHHSYWSINNWGGLVSDYSDITALVAFPTMRKITEPADLQLIARSAHLLVEMANDRGWKKVFMGYPGIGVGGLKYEDVKSILEPIFDDRFYVMRK